MHPAISSCLQQAVAGSMILVFRTRSPNHWATAVRARVPSMTSQEWIQARRQAEVKSQSRKFTEKKNTCGKVHGWAQRENLDFGKFKSLIRGQFSRFLLSFRPVILLCPPWLQLICLKTLPSGAHTPVSQDGSQSEVFWEEQDSLWPGIFPWLLTPRSFSASV